MAGVSVLVLTLLALFVVADSRTACDGDCVGSYEKCVGKDIFSLKSCCEDGDDCIMKNRWFGQCRPDTLGDRQVPSGWAGPVVDCTDCGPDSREPGEFNYADNEFCNIDFLGDFTLEMCGEVCEAGGYVACDRFDESPDEEWSCYGYFELFEGSCSMRNDNFNWNSWLTCKSDFINEGAAEPDGDNDEDPPDTPMVIAAAAAEAVAEDDSGLTAEEQKAADEAAMSRRRLA